MASQNMFGDTKLKLKRVQQLRKLVETEGDFPATGAGTRLEQVGWHLVNFTAAGDGLTDGLLLSTPCHHLPTCHCHVDAAAGKTANAAAAQARNKALQQSLAAAADTRPKADACKTDAQVSSRAR